jgi:hypothetical protein
VFAWLALAALVMAPLALAEYQGTDVFTNVAPPSQVDDAGALVNRHPSGHYALDTHVDTGLTNPAGLLGLIPHFLASQLWDLTKFLVTATISLFTWAFSLDLLTGGGSGHGALGPISEATARVYEHTFGRAWLGVGIVLAGLWGIWKSFVQRRYAETAGQLALSLAFVVLALFLVHQPEQTIGRASDWTNRMSLAFLSGATGGMIEEPHRAKARVADRLFRTLVHEPWVVLNFGGLRHCVDRQHRPVAFDAPGREVCIDHLLSNRGRGGYAERFLRFPPGSEARNAEYEAIKQGRIPGGDGLLDDLLPPLPDWPGLSGLPGDAFSGLLPGLADTTPDQFEGYVIDEDDRPAVDIQQQPAGFQRLTMAALIFAGDLGAVLLLGALSIAVILAQIFVLLFLAFTPLALVAGVFPGWGHFLFQEWLRRLLGALLRKAFYSLALAIVLAVGAALLAASSSLGWLYAFGLQAAFYWAVFLKRHALAGYLPATLRGPVAVRHPRRSPVRRLTRLVERARRPLRTAGRSDAPGQGRPVREAATASITESPLALRHDKAAPTQAKSRGRKREQREAADAHEPSAGDDPPTKKRSQASGARERTEGPDDPPSSRKPTAPARRTSSTGESPNREALERDLARARNDATSTNQPGTPPPTRRRHPRGES